MKLMKALSEESMFTSNFVRSFFVVLVVGILLFSVVVSLPLSISSTAEEDQEYEAPEWKAGDRWEYDVTEPTPEDPDLWVTTRIEQEVMGDAEIEVEDLDGGETEEVLEVYWVEETQRAQDMRGDEMDEQQDEDEEITMTAERGFTRDNLFPAYTDSHNPNIWESYYYPPLVELDFPLSIGDEHSSTEGTLYEVDPETDEVVARINIIQYQTKVEERVTKDINGEQVDALRVNFSYMGELIDDDNPEEGTTQWRREEIYYSPDIKNVVHRERYETRAIPPEEIPGEPGYEDEFYAREASMGNESLVGYYLEERRGEADELLSAGELLGVIGLIVVGASSIYVIKRWRSPE